MGCRGERLAEDELSSGDKTSLEGGLKVALKVPLILRMGRRGRRMKGPHPQVVVGL